MTAILPIALLPPRKILKVREFLKGAPKPLSSRQAVPLAIAALTTVGECLLMTLSVTALRGLAAAQPKAVKAYWVTRLIEGRFSVRLTLTVPILAGSLGIDFLLMNLYSSLLWPTFGWSDNDPGGDISKQITGASSQQQMKDLQKRPMQDYCAL